MKLKPVLFVLTALALSGCAGLKEQQLAIDQLSIKVNELKAAVDASNGRIDDLGNGKARIVDYKTGYIKYDLAKDDRERQLLLYALAMEEDPALKKKGLVLTELVLDMLEKEKPLAFVLENGVMTAPGTRIKSSSIEDIKQQVTEIAREIAKDYEQGFPVADTDQPCKRCSYKLYCPKWG